MSSLIKALLQQFSGNEKCICITGSGGKTTALIKLAEAYAHLGKRVLVSTTTKLQYPTQRDYQCDQYFYDHSIFSYNCNAGQRVFYAVKGNVKMEAPRLQDFSMLSDKYDVMLLEADGARSKGLKLHTDRDPVIPECTTATLAIFSLAVLGKPIGQHCFGWDETDTTPIDEKTFQMLLAHPQGIQKRMAGEKVILGNQADSVLENHIERMRVLSTQLPLIFGSLEKDLLI